MISLNLSEQEALTVREALSMMLQQQGLPAMRKVLAVDEKIVAAGQAMEESQIVARAEEILEQKEKEEGKQTDG